MKVKVPIALLLVLAMLVGYMLGTEQGRAQRDVILVKLGRKDGGDDLVDTVSDTADAAADAAAEVVG